MTTPLRSVLRIPLKAQIGLMKLDASVSEEHARTAKVTDNEVESGSNFTDHVKLDSPKLTMTGVISETPISILGLGVSVDDFLGASADFAENPESNPFEGLVRNERRTPTEAWQYLESLWRQRIPFNVVTSLQSYENLVIENLSSPRRVNQGRDLHFTARLKEIRTIRSSTALIPAFSTDDDSRGATTKGQLGKQSTTEATEAQGSNASILLQGLRTAGVPL